MQKKKVLPAFPAQHLQSILLTLKISLTRFGNYIARYA